MRVLLVGTGSRGGIGRYEQLLAAALAALESRGKLEWRGVWRRPHPAYLGPGQASFDGADGSIRTLLLSTALSARRWEPEVVCFSHVNSARIGPFLPLLGLTHIPYTVGTLGAEVWTKLSRPKRLALRRATSVFSISEYTRSKVIALQGLHADRCRVMHLALEDHWIDRADSSLAHTERAPADTFSLLSVCRLEQDARDKGIDWVLRAVARLAPKHPGLRYTVVGEGNDRSYLESLADDLGIQERVTFTGALDHDALVTAYGRCDLFVLPTRREGFGLVFIEAMAFRKPIVAMACAGTRDVVTSGEQGLLIHSQEELVGAIETIASDRTLAARMGDAGYLTATGPFSFAAFVLRLEALLEGTAHVR